MTAVVFDHVSKQFTRHHERPRSLQEVFLNTLRLQRAPSREKFWVLRDVSFQGMGCAICVSSASLMTEHLKGKSIDALEDLFDSFHAMLTDETNGVQDFDSLGKSRVFEGVRQFPVRVKCATLPWHTLRAAVEGSGKTVSTE